MDQALALDGGGLAQDPAVDRDEFAEALSAEEEASHNIQRWIAQSLDVALRRRQIIVYWSAGCSCL